MCVCRRETFDTDPVIQLTQVFGCGVTQLVDEALDDGFLGSTLGIRYLLGGDLLGAFLLGQGVCMCGFVSVCGVWCVV